ncbi:MAG: hypothetical protein KAR54_01345 [Candidatus Pacebacteria bacterium]|nr:hypothetical protein [Candidatus Paceibacterota bacterium]
MKQILILAIVFTFNSFFITPVMAQEDVEIVPTLYADESSEPTLIAEEPAEIEEIKTPSNLGLWWISVKETLSLATTLNPEKRVEKALLFAEQRMELAEEFAQNADTPEQQIRAEKMIEKATTFIEKAEGEKELVKEETKTHLEEVKARKERHEAQIETYQEEKVELIERIKAGDEIAKEELKNLNTERREEAEEVKQEIKAKLEIRAEEGDEGAIERLENIEEKKVELQTIREEKEVVETSKRDIEKIYFSKEIEIVNKNLKPVEGSKESLCSNAGGEWQKFSNTCANTCSFERNKENSICAEVITESCNCGTDKCWNGKSCEGIQTNEQKGDILQNTIRTNIQNIKEVIQKNEY